VDRFATAADPALRDRVRSLAPIVGPVVAARVTVDGRIAASDVAALVGTYGLAGPEDVMLLALPAAAALADPPISNYRVGAVGQEIPGGDLLLGGNLEFPQADLGRTLHAEGVVAIRAFGRETGISALAVAEARPCAYCRQTIAEFAWAASVRIIDPLGHSLTMADLYPWPFAPGDLSEPAAKAGTVSWPDLAIADPIPGDVAALLIRTGARAHAPYSRCPAAVVLRLRDDRLIAGATIESVAFNPTIGPLQSALANLRASGAIYADIESAYLAARSDGAVDDVRPTRDLLATISPDVALTTASWS
jgi:cytidine deaminase